MQCFREDASPCVKSQSENEIVPLDQRSTPTPSIFSTDCTATFFRFGRAPDLFRIQNKFFTRCPLVARCVHCHKSHAVSFARFQWFRRYFLGLCSANPRLGTSVIRCGVLLEKGTFNANNDGGEHQQASCTYFVLVFRASFAKHTFHSRVYVKLESPKGVNLSEMLVWRIGCESSTWEERKWIGVRVQPWRKTANQPKGTIQQIHRIHPGCWVAVFLRYYLAW